MIEAIVSTDCHPTSQLRLSKAVIGSFHAPRAGLMPTTDSVHEWRGIKQENSMDRAELGVDGNAGFALLGEDLQSGEAEFVVIDLPPEASKDPNRYHKSEWVTAAKRAATAAYRALQVRLSDRQFSYYLGPSHPDHC